MSAPEHDVPQVESRSKVKVARNAKGDPQWEVTVVSGEESAEIIRLREIAVEQYAALETALVKGGSS